MDYLHVLLGSFQNVVVLSWEGFMICTKKKIDLKVKGQATYSLMIVVVSVFIVSSGLNIHFIPVFYVI